MDTSPTIRERIPSDLPALVEVLRRVHDRYRYPVVWPRHAARWIGRDVKSVSAWVAVVCDVPVGNVSFVDHGDGSGWIERLFVDPDAGRSGLGRALLDRATATILDLGLEPWLEVADNGQIAQHLYRRAGWELVDRVPVDWGRDTVDCVLRFRRIPGIGIDRRTDRLAKLPTPDSEPVCAIPQVADPETRVSRDRDRRNLRQRGA